MTKMNKFRPGKRYRVHGSESGMLVIWRWDDKLLVEIDGVEMVKKSLGNFCNSEMIGTDAWHFASAKNELKEV